MKIKIVKFLINKRRRISGKLKEVLFININKILWIKTRASIFLIIIITQKAIFKITLNRYTINNYNKIKLLNKWRVKKLYNKTFPKTNKLTPNFNKNNSSLWKKRIRKSRSFLEYTIIF
jgi:hypothetical protein